MSQFNNSTYIFIYISIHINIFKFYKSSKLFYLHSSSIFNFINFKVFFFKKQLNMKSKKIKWEGEILKVAIAAQDHNKDEVGV